MTARIIGLATAVGLVVPASLGQVSTTSAAAAQFFVTGYVLRGYTATGTYVHPGTCAVDPRVIPLGSYITIAGLGTCHAEDTGGLIMGYRIDVWVPTVAQAYALTGWRMASWGPRPMPYVLDSHASQRQSSVPTLSAPHGVRPDQGAPPASTGTAMAGRYAPRITRATARAIVVQRP
jgi:3D (Asp-Asp-Asp) domain-containing protein